MGDDMRRILDERAAGRTVLGLFLDTVAERPDAVALRWHDGDERRERTWAGSADLVARVAGGLRALGVGRGDRVVLMMRNRPEFHVADLAVLCCGATPVSIYNSSSADQVRYLAAHCHARAGIFGDLGFLDRILEVRDDLAELAHLVVVDDPAGAAPHGVVAWERLVGSEPLDLGAAAAALDPGDLATVIYTSGTTGPPKGVALDHRNICWTVECYREALGAVDPTGWRAVSYLPMAHVAERMSTHYLGLASGFEVTTCPDPGQVVPYLVETRPQTFFAVPRVWEKAYAALTAAVGADPQRAAELERALEVGWEVSEHRARDEALPPDLAAAHEAVEPLLAAVRGMVGLDQAVICVTGAAPIPDEILRFFRGLGLPLSEIYGLSETSGPMTWTPFRVRVGTVGPPRPGIEVRVDDDGEVCCRGGNVFRGYLDAPAETAAVLDDEGWFRSGDVGVLDDDGYLRIVDRKKELIITAGGKNVSPANLEAALKAGPLVGQACVVGDGRKYVAALLVLDAEVAPVWAAQHGVAVRDLAALAEHPDVRAEIEREVAEANRGFSHAEQVKRFAVLAEEWLPDSEELTPTMKLKRRGIHQKHAREIDDLYA